MPSPFTTVSSTAKTWTVCAVAQLELVNVRLIVSTNAVPFQNFKVLAWAAVASWAPNCVSPAASVTTTSAVGCCVRTTESVSPTVLSPSSTSVEPPVCWIRMPAVSLSTTRTSMSATDVPSKRPGPSTVDGELTVVVSTEVRNPSLIASSTAVRVIVCGVFQSPDVNVCVHETPPFRSTWPSPVTVTVTGAVGAAESWTVTKSDAPPSVTVAVPPAATVEGEGVITTPALLPADEPSTTVTTISGIFAPTNSDELSARTLARIGAVESGPS